MISWWILLIIVLCRVWWQYRTNVWTCLLFWAAVCCSYLNADWHGIHRYTELLAVLGGCSNAVVTLANRGFMPATNIRRSLSIWKRVQKNDNSRLLGLADIYKGFSIGDFLIFGSILLSIIWGGK